MKFVSSLEIYNHAEQEEYVVAGFDSYCLEVIQAHIIAANEENSPFLLQVTPKGLRHIGLDYFSGMAEALIENSKVPVALHLDHGTNIQQITECIRNGFTSVMIDGSALPFDQNISITKKVVSVAHAVDVTVEAELGRVLGKESDIAVKRGEEAYTDPIAAQEFVQETEVDSLAISVGNVHGFYRNEPKIDFKLLEQIHKRVGIPLVFHGGTGLGPRIIQEVSRLGVRKINIGTLIKSAFTRGLKNYMENNQSEIDPRKILQPARESVVEELKGVLRMFGSSKKNWLSTDFEEVKE